MRYYLIILMAFLTFSCSQNRLPKGILTEKEITPVLVDLHLAEAIYAQRFSQTVTRENYQEDLYLSVLKKYKLDRKTFEKSVLYYGKHPDIYRPIYDEVLNRLSEMIAKTRATDSIQAKKIKAVPVNKDTLQANQIKAAARAKDSILTIKLKAEIRAKDSILAIKLKAKSGTKEAVKTDKSMVKPTTTDTVQVKKIKTKPAIKDSVQLIK